jgi:hypothetical protein
MSESMGGIISECPGDIIGIGKLYVAADRRNLLIPAPHAGSVHYSGAGGTSSWP